MDRCTITNNLHAHVLLLLLIAVLAAAPAHGADWQEAERRCLARCPEMPRYSGLETEAEYHRRMRLQAEHDRCFMKCAVRSAKTNPPSFVPIDEAARRYFLRNGAGRN